MQHELEMLETLNHPNIVRVLDLCEDEKFIYIICELIPNGDMMKVMTDRIKQKKPLSEGEVARWIWQLLTALNYLHTMKVMHRDLKLENVLMDYSDGEHVCKVTDFGFAHFMQADGEDNEIIGTPFYMAPEVINGKNYDNKVDIWALGVITAELLTGHPPFLANNKAQLFDKICNSEPNFSGAR